MLLSNHLVYVDVTSQCDVNCSFCMYAKQRAEAPIRLSLTDASTRSLAALMNDPATSEVVISGEGEPFADAGIVYALCALSQGKRRITLVTNGKWLAESPAERIQSLAEVAAAKHDSYTLRLSIDSYHVRQLGHEVYRHLFSAMASSRWHNLCWAVRAVLEDKEYVRAIIDELLRGTIHKIVPVSPLRDRLYLADSDISISYKNLVRPRDTGREDAVPLPIYLDMLEEHYGKPFTLGHLNRPGECAGLDVTIKPDGAILLYGLEYTTWGNVHSGEWTIAKLSQMAMDAPLVRTLYSVPFKKVLLGLNKYPHLRRVIADINNPYWVVKAVYECDRDLLMEVLGL